MSQTNKQKKITALIPCYNEAESIGAVIKSFPIEKLKNQDFALEIVVIDNNSTDATADVARALGATVLSEKKKGKGNAMRLGFEYAVRQSSDFVVMLDGDDTYRPEEILRLIEPLDSGFCTMVIGSRLGGRISNGSMTAFNRFGNWVFSHLVRYIYRVNITDVLTGYFAWTGKALQDMYPHLTSEGFAIEMEMVTKMSRLGHEIYSVPISYNSREGESNLRPVRDGLKILFMLIRNLFWTPSTIVATTDKTEKESKMFTASSLSVVIPALNEETSIRQVIQQVPVKQLEAMGYSVEIIVADNASTDKTAEIAREAGARVVYQPLKGYGNAYKAGFAAATGDIIATGDADMTYPFDALPSLLPKITDGGFDFVNTDRLKNLDSKAMTKSHVFGNWLLSMTTRILFSWPYRDSQSGMWIFKRSILDNLDLRSSGMPFSQELKIEVYVKGYKCTEVPIEYRVREGDVKLNTISDGFGNISQLFKKFFQIRNSKKEATNAQGDPILLE